MIVRVPPSKREEIGKAHLKETLPTSSAKEAEVLKWPVVARFKQVIAGVRTEGQQADRVVEALSYRVALAHEEREMEARGEHPSQAVMPLVVTDRAEQIEEKEGHARARMFVDIASGTATPVTALVDQWLKEADVTPRTEAGWRYAVKQLTEWCRETDQPETLEGITKRVAGRFVTDRFIDREAHPATTNKTITGLKSYWTWLLKRGHLTGDVNPWAGQRVEAKRTTKDGEPSKRPFTDAEVQTLIEGTAGEKLMGDFVRIAALTGARRDEVACLQVRDIRQDGNGLTIKVRGTKTDAARRDVPCHPDIVETIAVRTAGKLKDAFLFDELPEQKNPARGRGAPVSQAFTRLRRKLEVEDKDEGARQSRVDLHSLRRWFIMKARDAMNEGAPGFTPWTLADVVGHSTEDGELGMTMGRYPGKADTKALRACVEAVRLPKMSGQENV